MTQNEILRIVFVGLLAIATIWLLILYSVDKPKR